MTEIQLRGGIQAIDRNNQKGLMTTQIKVKDILAAYRLDPEVNRDLGYTRLPKIIQYVDTFDSEIGVFFPSIVCSFREDNLESCYDPQHMTLTVKNGVKLVVIDGQHRLKSLEQYVEKFEGPEERKQAVLNSDLSLQLYFGLSEEDEKILFADMNSNAKRVSMSLITNYDTRDIMNVLAKELYSVSSALQGVQVEFTKSRIVRPNNTAFTTSMRLKKIIALLLFGKKNVNNKEEVLIKENYDGILSFLERFFDRLFETLPEDPGNVLTYVLGHEPMQNAIAAALHKRMIMVDAAKGEIIWITSWEDEVEKLQDVNWSVKNAAWRPHMIQSRSNTPHEFSLFIESEEPQLIKILDDVL